MTHIITSESWMGFIIRKKGKEGVGGDRFSSSKGGSKVDCEGHEESTVEVRMYVHYPDDWMDRCILPDSQACPKTWFETLT